MSEHPVQSLRSQTHKISQKVPKVATRDDFQSIYEAPEINHIDRK